jgi:hypothetical protein
MRTGQESSTSGVGPPLPTYFAQNIDLYKLTLGLTSQSLDSKEFKYQTIDYKRDNYGNPEALQGSSSNSYLRIAKWR